MVEPEMGRILALALDVNPLFTNQSWIHRKYGQSKSAALDAIALRIYPE